MKKIFLLTFGAVFLFVSCKKDYTCTCEEKEKYDGSVYSYEYTYSVEGATKTQAQVACNEATIKQSSGGDSHEKTCKLK